MLYAEPDRILVPTAIPNDPDFNGQWGLKRIGAPAAWDISTGSPVAGAVTGATAALTTTICVIDSGVDPSHPDLKANLHSGVGYNAWDPSQPLADTSGHGTYARSPMAGRWQMWLEVGGTGG